MPPRWTPEHFAFGLIDEILLQGQASRLHRDLVQRRGYTDDISGGINLLGNMFNYSGPMLWSAALLHDPATSRSTDPRGDRREHRTHAHRAGHRGRARSRPPQDSRGSLRLVGSSTKTGLVDLLACFALFDDDPTRINRIEAEFAKVTPELVRTTAQEYLRRENRTVLTIEPGAAAAGANAP